MLRQFNFGAMPMLRATHRTSDTKPKADPIRNSAVTRVLRSTSFEPI